MSSPPRFLFDECLPGPAIVELAATHQIEFASLVALLGEQGALDNEWIPRIAAEGRWVVVTADGGKRGSRGGKLPHLCQEHKVTHVVISNTIHAKKTRDKLALISEKWEQIAEAVAKAPLGTRFRLRLKPARGSGILRVVLE